MNDNIDCLWLLQYLEKNGLKEYHSPEKYPSNTEYEQLKREGKKAVGMLNGMADLCAKNLDWIQNIQVIGSMGHGVGFVDIFGAR